MMISSLDCKVSSSKPSTNTVRTLLFDLLGNKCKSPFEVWLTWVYIYKLQETIALFGKAQTLQCSSQKLMKWRKFWVRFQFFKNPSRPILWASSSRKAFLFLRRRNGLNTEKSSTLLSTSRSSRLFLFRKSCFILSPKHSNWTEVGFHFSLLYSTVQLMIPAFYLSCDEILKEWEKRVLPPRESCELDVWPYLESITSDAISRTAFGSSYEEGRRIFELQLEQAALISKAFQSIYIPGSR